MRWKTATLGLVLACSLVASTAHAVGIVFAAYGGAGLPTSDYGDEFKGGYNLGGTMDVMLAPMLGLGVDLAYHDHKAKDEVNREVSDSLSAEVGFPVSVEIKVISLQYGVHATLMPPVPGGFHPYVQVGVAEYSAKFRFEGGGASVDSDKTTKVGFNVGGGAMFSVAPLVGIGVDGHYHMVGTKDDLGADLTWFTISGRVSVKLPIP